MSAMSAMSAVPRYMSGAAFDLQNAPFVHYRQRNGDNPKFKSPRKRASKLFDELNKEACENMRETKPAVFEAQVAVGDSVELEVITQGGIGSTRAKDVEKIRGVVIGKASRGLATSIHVRDVVYGEPVERKIHVYSPLVKSLKLLEKNFIYKGRRKVKRAKLYFLRERNPTGELKQAWLNMRRMFLLDDPVTRVVLFFLLACSYSSPSLFFRISSYEMVNSWQESSHANLRDNLLHYLEVLDQTSKII